MYRTVCGHAPARKTTQRYVGAQRTRAKCRRCFTVLRQHASPAGALASPGPKCRSPEAEGGKRDNVPLPSSVCTVRSTAMTGLSTNRRIPFCRRTQTFRFTLCAVHSHRASGRIVFRAGRAFETAFCFLCPGAYSGLATAPLSPFCTGFHAGRIFGAGTHRATQRIGRAGTTARIGTYGRRARTHRLNAAGISVLRQCREAQYTEDNDAGPHDFFHIVWFRSRK